MLLHTQLSQAGTQSPPASFKWAQCLRNMESSDTRKSNSPSSAHFLCTL